MTSVTIRDMLSILKQLDSDIDRLNRQIIRCAVPVDFDNALLHAEREGCLDTGIIPHQRFDWVKNVGKSHTILDHDIPMERDTRPGSGQSQDRDICLDIPPVKKYPVERDLAGEIDHGREIDEGREINEARERGVCVESGAGPHPLPFEWNKEDYQEGGEPPTVASTPERAKPE